jgi:hypothetical protein
MKKLVGLGCALVLLLIGAYLVGCSQGPPVNLGAKARLTMQAQVDGKQASVGVHLLELNSDADFAGPEAKQAVITVEVVDQQGKVVSSATGDLEKFGFS